MARVSVLAILAIFLYLSGSEGRRAHDRFRKTSHHRNKLNKFLFNRHGDQNTKFGPISHLVDDETLLKQLSKMKVTEDGNCNPPCTGNKVCMQSLPPSLTSISKCVHRRNMQRTEKMLRKSIKLLRRNLKHKHGKGRRGHRRGPHHRVSPKFGKKIFHKDSDMESPLRKMKIHKMKTLKNSVEDGRALLKQAEDMRELVTQGGYEPEPPTEDKYPVCKNKIGDMKKRLNGWFVERHQEVQHRDHPNRRPHVYGPDFKRMGRCNCARSVMWNFHTMDKDNDHQLSHEEREHIEHAFDRREKCVKPTIESCDKDGDSIITKSEWCCCFSDIESPCFEHIKLIERGSDGKGYKPSCTSEGYYAQVQCHKKSNYCWCSDLNGNPVAGSKVKGQPNCDEERGDLHRSKRIQMTPLFQ